ncbi:hypothetical protein QE152_g26563 [Popillia japonica]|uniref:Uncharacterized protein n=1 Tax=Popillia japonica TaxID=7064 RepID=A0AAW1JZ49_POPJA
MLRQHSNGPLSIDADILKWRFLQMSHGSPSRRPRIAPPVCFQESVRNGRTYVDDKSMGAHAFAVETSVSLLHQVRYIDSRIAAVGLASARMLCV